MEGNTNNGNNTVMGQFMSIFLDNVKQQGFSVILLIISIGWFTMKNNELEIKVDQCNAMQLQLYKGQIDYLHTVISENTKAISRNTDVMREVRKGDIETD